MKSEYKTLYYFDIEQPDKIVSENVLVTFKKHANNIYCDIRLYNKRHYINGISNIHIHLLKYKQNKFRLDTKNNTFILSFNEISILRCSVYYIKNKLKKAKKHFSLLKKIVQKIDCYER